MIFRQQWKIVLLGVIMQYVHGIFAQLAHRMHQPSLEPLHDVGFDLTPVSKKSQGNARPSPVKISFIHRRLIQELGPKDHWVSEALFVTLFLLFCAWTFSPFVVHKKKRFFTVIIWTRLLVVLSGETDESLMKRICP